MTMLPGALMPKRSMPRTLPCGADVFPPEGGDAGFDGDALGAGGGQDFVPVGLRLAVEALEAGQADDADAVAELLRGIDGVLQFGTGGEEDGLERALFLHEDVAALERAFAADAGAGAALVRNVLAARARGASGRRCG